MNKFAFFTAFLRTCALLAVFVVSACSSSSDKAQTRYKLYFQAHPEVNASAPLKVRVFQLKSSADFMGADFYSLQNNAQKVLGNNVVNSDEFFLSSSQSSKWLTGQFSAEVRYIAVLAEYQSLDGKKWRITLPVADTNERHFWQFSSSELKADFFLDVRGIQVITR